MSLQKKKTKQKKLCIVQVIIHTLHDIFKSQMIESHLIAAHFAIIKITLLLCFLMLHFREVIIRCFIRHCRDGGSYMYRVLSL